MMTYDPTTDTRTNEQKHTDYLMQRAIVRAQSERDEAARKARQEAAENSQADSHE